MAEDFSKCAACHQPFPGDRLFFSADFARYFSPTNRFMLTWCYSCARVLIYGRPFIHSLTRLQILRFKKALGLPAARETPEFRTPDRELGLYAGAHLLR